MSRKTTKNRKKEPVTDGISTPVTPVLDPEDEEDDELSAETSDAAPDSDPNRGIDAKLIPPCGWRGRMLQDEFFGWIPKYPQLKYVTFYVYRLEPNIDLTKTLGEGCETNIDKIFGKKFDYGFMRNKWGSGKYHVRMKDTRFRPASRQEVCDCFIDIDEYTQFPPVLDYRTLVDNTKNASFIAGLIAAKKLFRDEQGVLHVTPTGQPGATNGAGDNIAQKAFDLLEKQIDRNTQRQNSKLDETAGLTVIQTMSDAFGTMLEKVMKGTGDSGGKETLGAILSMMQTQNAMILKMIDVQIGQAHGGAAPGGKSAIRELIGEVTALMEAADKLGFTRGGGGSSDEKAPWWDGLARTVAPRLFDYLERNPVGGARTSGPTPTTIDRTPLPASPPTNGTPAADATVEAGAGMSRAELHTFARDVLKALQRGISGFDFAKSLDTMFDFATYRRIANAVSSGWVVDAMKQEPELVQTFLPYLDQLTEFMEDFVAYGKTDSPDADAPAGTTIPVAPAGAGPAADASATPAS